MRIRIGAAIAALQEENGRLDGHMGLCLAQAEATGILERHRDRLDARAYRTLSERMRARTALARAHWLLSDLIHRANTANLAQLRQLTATEADDTVDTEACRRRIDEALLIPALLLRELDASCPAGKDAGRRWHRLRGEAVSSLRETLAGPVVTQQSQAIQAVADYTARTAHLYDQAKALADGAISQAGTAIDTALANGTPVDLSWAGDIDGRYATAMLEAAKPLLSREEYQAYATAMKDGTISIEELYTLTCEASPDGEPHNPGTLNTPLWKALNKLPARLLAPGTAAACLDAIETMSAWDTRDPTNLNRALSLSFLPTGATSSYTIIRKPMSQYDSVFLEGEATLYEYRTSTLLERMGELSERRLQTLSPSESQWADRMATSQLLHMLGEQMGSEGRDGTKAIWGSQPDDIQLDITILRERQDSQAGRDNTARLITVQRDSVGREPDPLVLEYVHAPYTAATCVTGLPAHAMQMIQDLTADDPDARFDLYSSIEDASVGIMVGAIPYAGDLLSFTGDVAGDYLGYRKDNDQATWQALLSGTDKTDQSTPLHDMGFTLSYQGSTGEHGQDYTHPDTRIAIPEQTRPWLDQAIQDYRQDGHPDYTTSEFLTDLNEHPIDSLTGRNQGTDTYQFLKWCAQPAQLEYAHNAYNADGSIIHHEGEAVQGERISNYEFSRGKASEGYPDYRRAETPTP